jgi:glycosyltransferase involved in cell wall biosynthesis
VLTGSLNNLNSLETTLPEEHLKTLNKEPGPPFVHTTSFITPHFAFFRRELILQLGYVDCTEHYFASEYEEYLRRANRALGRNPDQYFIIPNTTKSLAIYNDPMEDWIHSESFDKQRLLLTANPEVKALHTRYQDKPPSYQINKHHGLPSPEEEYKNSIRLNGKGDFLTLSIPRLVKRVRKFNIQANPVPLTGNESVTVVIGHRGEERLPNLLNTINSFHGLKQRPQIIVVEQDTFPLCRNKIEPKVDQYIFTYSDHPYNRGWAFNVGAKLARTEFILLHDNDLVVPEDYLDQITPYVKNAHAAVCWGKISYLTAESTSEFPNGKKRSIRTITNEGIHGGSTLVRREFYYEIGGFDERFEGWGAEDDAFYEKARKLGRLIRANPNTGPWLFHLYHRHSGNKHQHWGRNKQLWIQYCTATPDLLRMIIESQPPIGDPERGKETSKSKLRINTVIQKGTPRKLHVIYDVPGWAYWHRAEALRKYAPPNWVVTRGADLPRRFSTNPPDIVLLLNYGAVDRVSAQLKTGAPHCILVGSMNVGWPRRLDFLMRMKDKCHHVLINNLEMYLKCGPCPGTSTISNGVDLEIFYPKSTPYQRDPFKVLWTGSMFHANLKGFNILRTVQSRLEKMDIKLELKLVDSHGKKLSQEEMATWYNTGNCYVVASESEGTPNPALEAAACGLPIVSTRVGNMPELINHKVNGYLIDDRNPKSIIEGILYAKENYQRLSHEILRNIKDWSWQKRTQKYFELFEMLIQGELPSMDWNTPNPQKGSGIKRQPENRCSTDNVTILW